MSDRLIMVLRFASLLYFYFFCSSQLFAGSPDLNTQFKNLLLNEYHLHPEAMPQDFYKFMYQAAMGPGHWKMDFTMAKEYLDSEVKTLKRDTLDPLCQYLTPDSALVRVYLQPYIENNGNIDSLAIAFARSSNEFVPSEKDLEHYILIFLQTVKEKKIPIPFDSALAFIKKMKEEKYQSVHHSRRYEEKYSPAYRVIFRKYLPQRNDNASNKN